MLSASIWSLIIPSIEMTKKFAWFPAMIGIKDFIDKNFLRKIRWSLVLGKSGIQYVQLGSKN
jgi:hypothetical protein